MTGSHFTINFDANHPETRYYEKANVASFKEQLSKYRNMDNMLVCFDQRTKMWCVNPTNDFIMYYNYCDYINRYHNDWNTYGYFDVGMVPYIMWPRFIQSEKSEVKTRKIIDQFRDVAKALDVNLEPVKGVTFLGSHSMFGIDYWVTREDMFKLYKAFGADTKDIVINERGEIVQGDIRNLTLTGLLERMVQIEMSQIQQSNNA